MAAVGFPSGFVINVLDLTTNSRKYTNNKLDLARNKWILAENQSQFIHLHDCLQLNSKIKESTRELKLSVLSYDFPRLSLTSVPDLLTSPPLGRMWSRPDKIVP